MRTIQWPEEAEPASSPDRPRTLQFGTTLVTPLPDKAGEVPGVRPRDALVLVVFVAIVVLVAVLLAVFGPLPRVFPALPDGGSYIPR